MSSARVSPTGNEDPRKRVTKKVKTREGVDECVEVASVSQGAVWRLRA